MMQRNEERRRGTDRQPWEGSARRRIRGNYERQESRFSGLPSSRSGERINSYPSGNPLNGRERHVSGTRRLMQGYRQSACRLPGAEGCGRTGETVNVESKYPERGGRAGNSFGSAWNQAVSLAPASQGAPLSSPQQPSQTVWSGPENEWGQQSFNVSNAPPSTNVVYHCFPVMSSQIYGASQHSHQQVFQNLPMNTASASFHTNDAYTPRFSGGLVYINGQAFGPAAFANAMPRHSMDISASWGSFADSTTPPTQYSIDGTAFTAEQSVNLDGALVPKEDDAQRDGNTGGDSGGLRKNASSSSRPDRNNKLSNPSTAPFHGFYFQTGGQWMHAPGIISGIQLNPSSFPPIMSPPTPGFSMPPPFGVPVPQPSGFQTSSHWGMPGFFGSSEWKQCCEAAHPSGAHAPPRKNTYDPNRIARLREEIEKALKDKNEENASDPGDQTVSSESKEVESKNAVEENGGSTLEEIVHKAPEGGKDSDETWLNAFDELSISSGEAENGQEAALPKEESLENKSPKKQRKKKKAITIQRISNAEPNNTKNDGKRKTREDDAVAEVLDALNLHEVQVPHTACGERPRSGKKGRNRGTKRQATNQPNEE
ncbi:hypothetical protein QR680_001014 [Steinernema hermaphroditum]|uniref:Uncharacterized protein n=1 Tax=Steinernema hermaphroditum TaxID=289476 RepID=A0AA39GWN8_9BILA|nr:hypothetical protein QR680_001014 [Steinernema hermaphroditum]